MHLTGYAEISKQNKAADPAYPMKTITFTASQHVTVLQWISYRWDGRHRHAAATRAREALPLCLPVPDLATSDLAHLPLLAHGVTHQQFGPAGDERMHHSHWPAQGLSSWRHALNNGHWLQANTPGQAHRRLRDAGNGALGAVVDAPSVQGQAASRDAAESVGIVLCLSRTPAGRNLGRNVSLPLAPGQWLRIVTNDRSPDESRWVYRRDMLNIFHGPWAQANEALRSQAPRTVLDLSQQLGWEHRRS